ncbi:hypothetical protein CDN99_01585 [Roseateles aquatilis]|uniref:Uncharacterized protein n=1 Tax=Roseateles aquatilis TaxID=431061 RepID=A0A246JL40_9BURK|nr:hypothetical protein [Roseateles aquatilis]OWQ93213.1 hypothetical protein CDN99_01585 [Roseateles aquatilis]
MEKMKQPATGPARRAMGSSLALVVAALAVTPSLSAQTTPTFSEYNKNIALLAAQGTEYYVNFHEPFSQQCIWGVAYIKAEQKGLYITLLAAKLAGRKINKITYLQAGGNGTICYLDQVELRD